MKRFPDTLRLAQVSAHGGRLSIRRQCELLDVYRSRLSYEPVGESALNLSLMELIDKRHLLHPEEGYPRMTDHLREQTGQTINPKRVYRLMRTMRIRSVLPGPATSQPNQAHKIYPYLLNGLIVNQPNQVWATDITYIPMRKGFMYLVAVMDWYSRYVLSWELSNSLETRFCIQALEEAFKVGQPSIFNSDQGAQFTSENFTQKLLQREIRISMDGKGRALDNRFVERLWWSVKYEHVYLYAYDSGKSLYLGLDQYFTYYNHVRRHSSLQKRTPAQAYFQTAEVSNPRPR